MKMKKQRDETPFPEYPKDLLPTEPKDNEEIDDGGPAFALSGHPDWGHNAGMSLRDYFAGQALAGTSTLLAEDTDRGVWIPELAYELADGMLKARLRCE
tara:strand:+ start:2113 stop:2409 length:297 start_codon:yes stop_codon:yes gene_type:complete